MIDKCICILEHGLFQSLAHRLAREYDRVLLFRAWTTAFPTANELQAGKGYDEFERIETFWDKLNEIDTFCFADSYFSDWAKHLRELGKRVWSPFGGEELEMRRWQTKELLQELGLPVQPCELVTGMKELRAVLKKREDQYVKVDLVRGLGETWHHVNYELSKPKLDEVEHILGGMADIQEFIIEDNITTKAEVGYDGWCIDGRFPQTGIVAVESKDAGCFAMVKPYRSLPQGVLTVNDALAPTLAGYGYRAFFSTEIRIGKQDRPYLIDVTARAASPCGECYQELFSNLGEVIEAGANGDMVEPIPVAKYAAQAILASDFAEKNWMPIFIPENIRQFVKLYNSTRIDDMEYIIPTDVSMREVGSVVGTGDSPDAAIKACEKMCERVEGFQLRAKTEILREAQKDLMKVL